MKNSDIEKLQRELNSAKGEHGALEATRVTGALEAFKKHRAEVAEAAAKVEWLHALLQEAQLARDAQEQDEKRVELAELTAKLERTQLLARLRPIAERIVAAFADVAEGIGEMGAAIRDLNETHGAAFSILQQLGSRDPSIREPATDDYHRMAQGLTQCLRLLSVPALPMTELQAWFGIDAYNAIRLAGGSHNSLRSDAPQLRAAMGDSADGSRSDSATLASA